MSEFKEQLMQVLIDAANAIAEDIVADARDRISDSYPPASEPNTPPHRRSSDLYESVNAGVIVDDDKVTVECGSPLDYAEFLEYGTDRMAPRPMWEALQEDWTEKAPTYLSKSVENRFT